MDRDIERAVDKARIDLDQILAEHSEDDSGRCVLCGTAWPCLVWVDAREESDNA